MCGRIRHLTAAELAEALYGTTNHLETIPGDDMTPGRDIPIILASPKTGERRIGPARWGLIPAWAKDERIGYKAINARAETLAEKPMFRDAFRRRRCIIPADGYYEWQKPTRQRYYFAPSEPGGFFSFAGLWERWRSPAGETIISCSIVTTAANAVVGPVHDRMPVALSPEAAKLWLSAGEDIRLLASLCRPLDELMITAWPVSKAAGNHSSNQPGLIDRINSQ